MNTIADECNKFATAINLNVAPEQTKKNIRMAFLCGARAMFSLQLSVSGKYSEEAACAIMDGWAEELKQFEAQAHVAVKV